MNDLAKLLAPPTSDQAPFPASSRYYGQALRRVTLPDGREIAFVARRFLPPLDAYQQTDVHSIQGGDRLDLLGAKYFADPEAGWRIVEANGIRDPREALQEAGSRLVIATVSAIAARGK
jgi:hypothetical protein